MADTDLPSVEMTQEPAEPQPSEHPFWQDLNPHFLEGENYGLQGPQFGKTAQTAYDVKELNRRLQNFEDDELKKIPILPEGSRLEQGATYLDLRRPGSTAFTATGDMIAGPDNWYAPKAEVPYWLWNRLTGVTNPEQLDQTGGS